MTPITAEAQLHYEEGWNLYTSNNFRDAAVCLRKAAVLKHPLAAALLSELLFWGRTGLAIDKQASLKLAQDGAELGCVHCKGMLATHLKFHLGQDEEKCFELARESCRAGSCFGQMIFFFVSNKLFDISSVKFLRLSAAQGYPQALHFFGLSKLHDASAEDKLEAMSLFRLASDQVDIKLDFVSYCFVACDRFLGPPRSSEPNRQNAVKWHRG